jgi:hypothetical protein
MDDLRRMREAKFAAKPVTKNQEAVTKNAPVTINPPIPDITKPKRGRPPTGKAMSGAERTRRYRQRKADITRQTYKTPSKDQI